MQTRTKKIKTKNTMDVMGTKKLTVLVLLGGPSAEREVSLVSGQAVAQALNRFGHVVLEGDISPENLNVLEQDEYDVVFPVLHGTFGEDGEFPIAPIYVHANNFLVKEWYTGPHTTDGIYGGTHWNAYSIDMSTKLAARGE